MKVVWWSRKAAKQKWEGKGGRGKRKGIGRLLRVGAKAGTGKSLADLARIKRTQTSYDVPPY
jgi:hypothetical protein